MKLLTKLLIKLIIELEKLNKNVKALETAVNRNSLFIKKTTPKKKS